MTVDELQVLITAKTTQLQNEINKANNSINSLKKSASKTQNGVMSAFKKLKTGIVALGIGKVIKDSIQLGMDAIESDNLFEVSMGNMADSVKEWSEEVGNALGLSATEMRKSVGTIYNMTTSMGLAEDNALKMSKGVTLLANDMASFYNLSTEEAFNKINAGLTGETEPLKRLGILVDENTIKQVAYQQGIAETGSELTQQQKVLARYCAILQQTGNAQGDLARTLDSPSNMLRQLKSQVQQLGITFGSFFMPILQAVIPYITAFAKVITYALNSLSKFLGLNSTNASSETENISSNISGVGSGLDDANDKAKKLKKTLAGFDEMNVLQDNSSDSSSSGATAGGGVDFDLSEYDAGLDKINSKVDDIVESIQTKFKNLGKFLGTIWNSAPVQAFSNYAVSSFKAGFDLIKTLATDLQTNLNTTWDNISSYVGITTSNMTYLWTDFWSTMQVAIEEWAPVITESISTLFNSIWAEAIEPAVQMITQQWADFTNILVNLWDEHGKTLIDNVMNFVDTTIGLFQSIWDNVLEPIITPFLEAMSWLWDEHLKGMVEELGNFIAKLINGVLEIYNGFIAPVVDFLLTILKPVISWVATFIADVVGSVFAVISDVFGGIFKALGGLIDFITGVFTGNWSKAWDGIKSFFSGIWDGILGILKGVVNLLIDVLNFFIGGLNKISFNLPDWDILGDWAGKKLGFNIPKIPKLARGGVVDKPTYAMIGENGSEAVMPLERNTGWIDQLAEKLNNKSGDGTPIQLVVKIGDETIFNKFLQSLKDKNFEMNGEVFDL